MEVVQDLYTAIHEDFGTERLPAPEGWELVTVEPRRFRRLVPVVALKHGEERLSFIVTPTDAREPAFKRTARYDITYFSEDVPDDAQDVIYRRDRGMIELFARWMAQRDASARSHR